MKHHEKKKVKGINPKDLKLTQVSVEKFATTTSLRTARKRKKPIHRKVRTPAFLPHLQYLAESELQNGPAEIKACSQNEGEKCVNNRWLDLDEGIVVQIDRQEAKNHNEDARTKAKTGMRLRKIWPVTREIKVAGMNEAVA